MQQPSHSGPIGRQRQQRGAQDQGCPTHGLRVTSLTMRPELALRILNTCQSCAKATVRNVVVTTALSSKPAKLPHASATKVPAVMAKLWRTMATHCGRPRMAFIARQNPKVAAEMALSVLAYNLTRVMNIVGTKPLMVAIVA